jgi:paraquat-inducible protein B
VSAKANPTVIGVFLLGAIALIVTGLMVFGGGRFFTETVIYVAYFPETVSGLNDGAPVNFRGVKVGTVRRIEVQLDAQDLSVRSRPTSNSSAGGFARSAARSPRAI